MHVYKHAFQNIINLYLLQDLEIKFVLTIKPNDKARRNSQYIIITADIYIKHHHVPEAKYSCLISFSQQSYEVDSIIIPILQISGQRQNLPKVTQTVGTAVSFQTWVSGIENCVPNHCAVMSLSRY